MHELMKFVIETEMAKARAVDEIISSRYRLVKRVAVVTALMGLSVFFWVLASN